MDSEREDMQFKLKVSGKEKKKGVQKVNQEQIHDLLFGEQLSWQAIIYDLINSEQLDPWDIDLVLLSSKYLEKIRELEEANLFISSKVLYAAALLLRIKSEVLLNHYLPSLDSILFGTKEDKKYIQERIDLEEEIPGLVLRTPLPRHRKVSLRELLAALGKAVMTENRRIKKVVIAKQQEIETAIALPRSRIDIKDRIKTIYNKLKQIFVGREERVAFSEVAGEKQEDKILTFVPLLYLDTQHKVLLEQEKYLDEIYIWLKHVHEKKYKKELGELKKEVEEAFARDAAEEELERQMEMEKQEEEETKKKVTKKVDVERESEEVALSCTLKPTGDETGLSR